MYTTTLVYYQPNPVGLAQDPRDAVEKLRMFHNMRNIRKVTMPGTLRISSAEFQKNIGRYQDAALTQPVTVTRNGRDRTVLISVEEYHRLKRRDRRVMGVADFSAEDIAAIETATPPADAARFDGELG